MHSAKALNHPKSMTVPRGKADIPCRKKIKKKNPEKDSVQTVLLQASVIFL